MDIAAVRSAIAKLGTGEYQDGSSATPGWTYQPIGDWIPELADIPCHKPEAVRDDFWAVVRAHIEGRSYKLVRGWGAAAVIDLAAANGYYALGLEMLGVESVDIEERDPKAMAVLDALELPTKGLTPRNPKLKPYDVALAMNVHMWWAKQGLADERLRWCAANAATTYFQTAGKHSGGMCIIPELDSEEAERRYLERYFARVHHVRDTTLHGGIRRLWRCES